MTSFRPLSGYLISKCCTDDTTKNTLFCFRPLSGYLISKWCLTTCIASESWSFRPLSGYLISKWGISMTKREIQKHEFPSPLGVSYFQIASCIWLHNNQCKGFRPLSGYLISKYNEWHRRYSFSCFGFRPLSGYLISKYTRKELNYD